MILRPLRPTCAPESDYSLRHHRRRWQLCAFLEIQVFVRNHMQSELVTVSPETSLGRAITMMDQAALRALPVVDHGGLLRGMLGERDVWWCICQDGEAALARSVQEVMDPDPPTIGLNAHFDDALRMFSDDRDPDVVAVVGEGRLAGVLTRRSFLGMVSRLWRAEHAGHRVEVSLGNGKDDLAIAFEVLRRSPAELVCASVACSRDDGDDPVLALRLANGEGKLLERELSRAGLVLLVPESEWNGTDSKLASRNGRNGAAN